MFSTRLPSTTKPNRLTELLQRKLRAGSQVLDLTQSNPTQAGITYPETEILQALSTPAALEYQPAPQGLETARQAVARYYEGRGIEIESQDVLMTASTSEAYSFLFKLLADPGGSILIPQPSYPLFDFLAALESMTPLPYPLYYQDQWSLDVEELRIRAHPSTRALLLVNPNNPTGSFISPSEWHQVVEFSRQTKLPIICDEVFHDFRFPDAEEVFDPASETQVPVFLLNGLSKLAALPQLKLGWIALRGPREFRKQALTKLELISDTYLSVATPVQLAAPTLLQLSDPIRQQIQDRLNRNRKWLQRSVQASWLDCLRVQGGWYAVLRVPATRSDQSWALKLLSESEVLVHPGYFFGFSSGTFLIVSLLVPEETFRAGIYRLLESQD